jgi:predicted glycoside hydrolase/deacetylase ChbG (UPF0249 family)
MAVSKRLIVNADDLGQSQGINRGILAAHERGIVTSASLMVRGQAAEHAADVARAHPRLGVGLHIDLGEWTYRAGAWVELYRRVNVDDAPAVEAEVAHQFEEFRRLVGRDPTHLDSHQHVHRNEPAKRIVLQLGDRLGVSVRHFTPGVAYYGDFYGQDEKGQSYPNLVSAASLVAILEQLAPGVTELSCHPGETEDLCDTMYVRERRDEMNALRDPRVLRAMDELGVKLISFRDLDLEST